jgi:hypothetical protein
VLLVQHDPLPEVEAGVCQVFLGVVHGLTPAAEGRTHVDVVGSS